MSHFRSNPLLWIICFGCLSTQANAFVGVRPPVAEVVPSSSFSALRRSRPSSSFPAICSTPLRALPVDTEAIRLLSGAAGSGAGINTNFIFDGLGSMALTFFGAFIAFNFIFVLLVWYLISTVFDDLCTEFVETVRDKYPEKWENLHRSVSSAFDDDLSELLPEEAAKRKNDPKVLMVTSLMEDTDFTTEIAAASLEKIINEKFGFEEQEDSQKN